ncbi:MAG: hypothetical protein VYC61_03215, partial [Candidatus Neomarinimicrobiota bacterium]|nr:hypothetical protein [Candidatus Neomarinimicrobiota bacterium]
MTTKCQKRRWNYNSEMSESEIIKISHVYYPYLDTLLENFLAMNTQREGYFKHWKSQIKLCFLAKMLKDKEINCAFYNDDAQVVSMDEWAQKVVEFLFNNRGAIDYRTPRSTNIAALNAELRYNYQSARNANRNDCQGPCAKEQINFENRQQLVGNFPKPEPCLYNRNLSIMPRDPDSWNDPDFPNSLVTLIQTPQGAYIRDFLDIGDFTMYENVFNYNYLLRRRQKAQNLNGHPNTWATKMYNWANQPHFSIAKQWLKVYSYGGSPKLNEYTITATATHGFQDINNEAGFHNNIAISSQTQYDDLPRPPPLVDGPPGYYDVLTELLKLYSDEPGRDRNFRQYVTEGTNFPEEGIWVYRGVRLLNLKEGSTPHRFKEMIGTDIPQFAFASTTIDPAVAIHFQKYNGGGNFGHSCCVYKIKIRKESRVLYLYNSEYTKLTDIGNEEEILLPFGCYLRIIDVNYEYISSANTDPELGETIAERNQKLLVITCELIDSDVLSDTTLTIVEKTAQIVNATANAYRESQLADLNALLPGAGAPCCENGYGAQANLPGYGAQANLVAPYPVVRRDSRIFNVVEERIGDEFVRILPTFGELNEVANAAYTATALAYFRGYQNNLNNIELTKFDEGKENDDEYIIKYIRDFSEQIFNNISTIQYPKAGNWNMGNVPRCGHGGLNHLRSLKGGVLVIKALMESELVQDNLLFGKIFKTKSFIVMLILSTMFESIMRIDEEGSKDYLFGLEPEGFQKLYPNLGDELNVGTMSPHQMASSALHLTLMRKCFAGNPDIDDNTIQTLSRGVSYFWKPDEDDIGINDLVLNNDPPDNLLFFIYYVIIIVGHYLDHCRFDRSPPQNFPSRMINSPDIEKLLELFNISERKKKELIKEVIKTLIVTLYENYDGNQNEISNTNMTQSCYKLKGKKIHGNCVARTEDFLDRALNFDVAWRDIGLSDVIEGLLETEAADSHIIQLGGKRRTRKSVRKHRGGSAQIYSVGSDELKYTKILSKEMAPSKSNFDFDTILKTKTNQKINQKTNQKINQ